MPRLVLSHLLLMLLFFVSGATALIDQVVWERLLGLWSGSDVTSAALIVSAFLTGLGAGSLLGARKADLLSPRRCVACFGWCNLGIGAFTLLSPVLFYDLLYRRLSYLTASRTVTFVVAFAALLLPTLLMGLSLPLLARAVVARLETAPGTISRLYAVDLLGAAAGAFAGTWMLIGSIGIVASLYAGAALSIGVGLAGLRTARNYPELAEPAAPGTGVTAPPSAGGVVLWCSLFFLSGFLAIALEMVWFRYFAVVTWSTAYGFGHVLGAFLLFDGLGMRLGARAVQEISDPRRLFIPLQGCIVLAATLPLLLLGQPWLAPLLQFSIFDHTPLTLGLVFGLVPLLVIAPGATLVGFSFPLVQRALQTDGAAVGLRVGQAQFANIAGNATGGLVTGLVLLHHLGTIDTLRLLCVVAGVATLTVSLRPGPWRPARGWAGAALALTLAAVALAFPTPDRYWSSVMGLSQKGVRVKVEEDGAAVALLAEGNWEALLATNGARHGAIPYARTHFLLGASGPLLHERARTVYIIGIGAGGSACGAGILPEVEQVHVVEIAGSLLSLLEGYARTSRGSPLRPIFEDPRFHVSINDARRELALERQDFDVIEADAIFPQGSRSGMLYSLEFFDLVKQRLGEHGIMVQWAATPRVRATFKRGFPFGLEGPVFLVGSKHPIVVDHDRIRSRLARPQVRGWIEKSGIKTDSLAGALTSLRPWSPDSPRAVDTQVLTDLHPRDEFYLNHPLF